VILIPGARLGPYEIIAQLGAGGMGEVYAARDTRLGRTVAIKVLAERLSADPQARQRIEREARAVSSINHPHICTLYDIGHESDRDYLVMERLEGEALDRRLGRGRLPITDVMSVALQIADALASAHEHGIVHRDLKPANIMLTKSGVKLLDFGLARHRPPVDDSVAESPTASVTRTSLTAEGIIEGTLPYMAPEAVRGAEPDARADLFAFGAVLYEMVTGRRAFGAGTLVDTIAEVLGTDPPAPRSLRPETPALLDHLITACLAKDPTARWQAARDAALQLTAIDHGASRPAGGKRRVVMGVAGVAAGVALGLAGALLWPRPAAGPPGPTHLVLTLGAAARLVPADSPAGGSSVAVSRDGRLVVFAVSDGATSRLVLRDLGRREETPLPGTEGAYSPFFSPGGLWVGFFTETALKKVPLAGGVPVTICATPPVARGAVWGDDDVIYFSPSFSSGLQKVPAEGGQPADLTELDLSAGESNHLLPEVLPGGEAILFTVWNGGTFDEASVWALTLRTGDRKRLIESASAPRYVEPGYLIFARNSSLLAVPFDPTRLTLLGATVPVVDGVWSDPATGAAHYAVAPGGTLVYAPGQYTVDRRRIVWVDRNGRMEPLPIDPNFFGELQLSPDGRRLAVTILNDIWIYDMEGRTTERLTFRGVNQFPIWAPDGRHITFSSSQGTTTPKVFSINALERGEATRLGKNGGVQFPGAWTHDGRVLAYVETSPVGSPLAFNIWLLRSGSGQEPQPLIQTPFKDDQPAFSPDDRTLAYVSDETGRLQVYVLPFPGPGRRVQVSIEGGTEPVWSRRGNELFFRDGRRYFSVPVRLSDDGSLEAGRPELLFEGDFVVPSFVPGMPSYDVAPDGRHFLMVTRASDTPWPDRLDVVLDWTEELGARVRPYASR